MSASGKAASTSPSLSWEWSETLPAYSGWSCGAPSAMASSALVTAGSTSYSTSMSERAASAAWALAAATPAIAWPLYTTLSEASTLLLRWRSPMSQPPGSGRSFEVTTARTSGWACARLVSMDLIVA